MRELGLRSPFLFPRMRKAKPQSPYPLNHPGAVAQAMTINSLGADHISATTIASTPRRTYTLPKPPAGSRIQFDLTTSAAFHLRTDDDIGLELPTETLWSTTGAGSYAVDVVIPDTTANTLVGFLIPGTGVNFQITNWRVTLP